MKGYVQIYTGNGKGKTTAAIGLSIRACGAGLKVYIAQFLKKGNYSEIKALKRFSDLITIKQFGSDYLIKSKPTIKDIEIAKKGIEKVKSIVSSGNYKIVILDEANVAVKLGLFSAEHIINIIDNKPEEVEIIITGRDTDQRLIAKSDLVTEMKEIKHYFSKGVNARVGIEK